MTPKREILDQLIADKDRRLRELDSKRDEFKSQLRQRGTNASDEERQKINQDWQQFVSGIDEEIDRIQKENHEAISNIGNGLNQQPSQQEKGEKENETWEDRVRAGLQAAGINNEEQNTAPSTTETTPNLVQQTAIPQETSPSSFQLGTSYFKKVILAPVAAPLQRIITFGSKFQNNPELFLLANGETPESLQRSINYHHLINPRTPEEKVEQEKALEKLENAKKKLLLYEGKHPHLGSLFRNYFQHNHLSLAKTTEQPYVPNRWVKLLLAPSNFKQKLESKIQPKIFKKISQEIPLQKLDIKRRIKNKVWQFAKNTRAGKWVAATVAKLATKLGLGAVSGGTALVVITLLPTAWKAIKKVLAFVAGYIANLAIIAGQYGFAALSGLFTGLVMGFSTGGLLGAVVGATLGTVGGIAGQVLINKAIAALKGFSIPHSIGSIFGTSSAGVAAGGGKIFLTAVGTTAAGSMLVIHTISSAFMIPPEPSLQTGSENINVVKTAAFSGSIGQPITYTIRIEAVGKNLTNVSISDSTTATCKPPNNPTISPQNWTVANIDSGSSWETSYTVNTDASFDNCLINNIVEVVAATDTGTERAVATTFVSIGDPPLVIPQGLPIHDNPQRSGGYTYHGSDNPTHAGIDVNGSIGGSTLVPVYSTFPGESVVVKVETDEFANGCGHYVILSAGEYQILLCHFAEDPMVTVGQKVGSFAQVGIQGTTGISNGPHVHYVIYKSGVAVDPRQYGVPSPPW